MVRFKFYIYPEWPTNDGFYPPHTSIHTCHGHRPAPAGWPPMIRLVATWRTARRLYMAAAPELVMANMYFMRRFVILKEISIRSWAELRSKTPLKTHTACRI
jgi:hypothetical protein